MVASLKKVTAVVALMGAAYAGFRWGPAVFPRVEGFVGWAGERVSEAVSEVATEVEPTPELADSTLGRFERFRSGEGPDRMSVGGPELSAVVRHALAGIIPPGVDEPTVALSDGRVQLRARVALEAFPRLPALDEVLGILPDTVLVELEGSLVPHDRQNLALLVDRVEVARIPIPSRFVGEILAGFRRPAPDGFPSDALSVPLPEGLESVYVQRDSLVLQAAR
jgi:hypothetical protein